MVRAHMVDLHGDRAYTDGYQVVTTLDARLQSVANQSLRGALLDYDRRHGYRGAEGAVALPQDLSDSAALEVLLEDYPPIGGIGTAVVLDAGEQSARLFWCGREHSGMHLDAARDTQDGNPLTHNREQISQRAIATGNQQKVHARVQQRASSPLAVLCIGGSCRLTEHLVVINHTAERTFAHGTTPGAPLNLLLHPSHSLQRAPRTRQGAGLGPKR